MMLPETMDAYRWFHGAKTLTRATVPVPKPADDEVLVKVLAAGVCHSDLHLYSDSYAPTTTEPFTMGHEGAGEIIALGDSVPSTFPDLHLTQYVVILGRNPCLLPTCRACSSDADNICRQHSYVGLGIDGSYAPYVAVAARSVVPVNATKEEIPPAVAAVSTDAVLTSYHALRDLKAGETVLIIGVGGLGINAIQIAKHVRGAKTVIASDTRDISLQVALEVGADYTTKPEDLGSLLSSNSLVVDFACDFVGLGVTFKSAYDNVRSGGTVSIVGLGSLSLEFPLISVAMKEVTFKTNFWGTKKELKEVLAAVKAGSIKPVVETRPLSQAIEVLDDLKNEKLKGRVALVPGH